MKERKVISRSVQRRLGVQIKENPNYKTVLMPIRVPRGKYCWNHKSPHQVCTYFNNEYGHPGCELGLFPQKEVEGEGVLKPKTCLDFKEKEEM